MIIVQGLQAVYSSNKKKNVLNNINLKIDTEKVAIIGPNGSGKTTLLRAILGLVNIRSGVIYVFGRKLENIHSQNLISSNLPEIYRLLSLKMDDLIRLYSELKDFDPDSALSFLREFQMEDILNKKLYELSTGQMKMACNILALSSNSKAILLDEPFENVDYARKIKLLEILNNLDSEIILNTHELQMLSKLNSWTTYFMIDGNLSGGFIFNSLDELFLVKGKVDDAISYIETPIGTISLMRSRGDVPLSKISNIEAIWEMIR